MTINLIMYRRRYPISEILAWITRNNMLMDEIIEDVWSWFHDEFPGTEEEFGMINDLAGELYQTRIEVFESSLIVTIYREEKT